MVLNTPEGERWVATSADSVFLAFDNDLLNGFWHDMDSEYMFISEHSPSYPWVAAAALEEGGFQTILLGKDDYNLTDPQVESIVGSLGRFLVYTVEKDLREQG